MNTEQERADFEAWAAQHGHDLDAVMLLSKPPKFSHYVDQVTQAAFEAYQAGRASLQSQDREDAELVELLREAAEIIAAVPTDYTPENLRRPIVDELEGFALMLEHARRAEEDGK